MLLQSPHRATSRFIVWIFTDYNQWYTRPDTEKKFFAKKIKSIQPGYDQWCNLRCHFFSARGMQLENFDSIKIRGSVHPLIVNWSVERSRIFFTFFESEWKWQIALTLLFFSFFYFFSTVHDHSWPRWNSRNLLCLNIKDLSMRRGCFCLVKLMFGETCGTFISIIRPGVSLSTCQSWKRGRTPASLFNNKLSDASIDHEHVPPTKLDFATISALYCNAFAFRNITFDIEVKIEFLLDPRIIGIVNKINRRRFCGGFEYAIYIIVAFFSFFFHDIFL